MNAIGLQQKMAIWRGNIDLALLNLLTIDRIHRGKRASFGEDLRQVASAAASIDFAATRLTISGHSTFGKYSSRVAHVS